MKKNIIKTLSIILLLTGCNSAVQGTTSGKSAQGTTTPAKSTEIQVSAAVSLTESLNEIAAEYAKTSQDKLTFNFGGSGTLRKQIEEGAPCDIFISASKGEMDKLNESGNVDTPTRVDLLTNSIVLVGKAELSIPNEIKTVPDILNGTLIKSIAVGQPDAVPAGKYGVEALNKLGLFTKVEPLIIYTKDVRQALDYVETGNTDAGIVYKTDAMTMKSGKILADFPMDSYTPVLYPGALTKNAKSKEAAQKFLEFLKTETAKKIFEKNGFTPL